MKEAVIVLISLALIGLNACKNEQSTDLKIMSYNIRHGEGIDTLLDLSRSAEIIKSQSPDICGLQEIDNYCVRSNRVGQTDFLAQFTSMTGTFGKFFDYDEGEYGMATLIAKPIISSINLQLPDGKYEPRTSIVQEIQIAEACTIAFANVHFDWIHDEEGNAKRLEQAQTLVAYVDSLNLPTIIMGDFNCTPDSPTMQYFEDQGFIFFQKGEDNLSFQGNTKSEIDHIIYRNSGNVKFEKKKIYLLNEPIISDHRPLVAELEVFY